MSALENQSFKVRFCSVCFKQRVKRSCYVRVCVFINQECSKENRAENRVYRQRLNILQFKLISTTEMFSITQQQVVTKISHDDFRRLP